MKLFIIGLPGSGKSTLGKKLGTRLNLPFLDLDERIEADAEQPIRAIFANEGEAAFRNLERDALYQTIDECDHFILATGGGAPCFFDNMEVMNRTGTTLFLDVPIPTIITRMHGLQITDRPLLQGLNQNQMLKEYTDKFEKRLPVYRQAQITISHNASEEEIVAQLYTKN